MDAGYSFSDKRRREEFAEYGSNDRSNDPWSFFSTDHFLNKIAHTIFICVNFFLTWEHLWKLAMIEETCSVC